MPPEVQIDALAALGDGVGRGADGRVVFVAFAAPGDRVRVRVVEEHARHARAEIEALLEAGPSRVAPRCPRFGVCGGCAWQHVAYPEQVAAKTRILEEAVQRIGRLELPGPVTVQASPSPFGYRIRARVLVTSGGVGYRGRRSHALCATDVCPVLHPSLERALADLAGKPPAAGEWELALGDDGTVRVAALPASGPGEPIRLRVGPDRLRVSPGGFAQANGLLLEDLARAVLEAAGSGERALELYAGAGFLTLGLARRFRALTAIEADPRAASDLRENLHAAELPARVVCGAVETALEDPALAALRPEVVVLDPPRAGLAPGAAARLATLGASRIVYLSCDPATLARDLAGLVRRGYRLASLAGFDLFPQTPHVEALAVLRSR